MDNLAYKYDDTMYTVIDCEENFDAAVEENHSYIKQRIVAIIMIVLSIATIPILGGDATFAVFMLPCMLFLLFSNEHWIMEE